jgi:hypothetical protein
MTTTWIFEKRKSFSVPYEELFRKCALAIGAINLKITAVDESLGLIEAEKPPRWPFKSHQQISVTVHRNSKVTAIGKLELGLRVLTNLSDKELVTDKFFQTLQDIL